MGLEDLLAIVEDAEAEARADAEEKKQLPPTEAMRCTLNGGSTVIFDVPNTRR